MRMRVLYAREPRWVPVVERADEIMAGAEFRTLKAEGRTTAGIAEIAGYPPIFFKRSSAGSHASGLTARFTGSRAARALAGARMLDSAALPHPAVMAAADLTTAATVVASYLITEAITGADSLSRFALGPGGRKGRDARRRRAILDTVAREVRRMHDAGIYTRDLQETNVMVADDGAGGFRVWFIDMEDFRRARNVSRERRWLNLVHLDRSIGRFLCRAARLAFLYAYLGRRPGPEEARATVRGILALRARIDRRHARRRDSKAVDSTGGGR